MTVVMSETMVFVSRPMSSSFDSPPKIDVSLRGKRGKPRMTARHRGRGGRGTRGGARGFSRPDELALGRRAPAHEGRLAAAGVSGNADHDGLHVGHRDERIARGGARLRLQQRADAERGGRGQLEDEEEGLHGVR